MNETVGAISPLSGVEGGGRVAEPEPTRAPTRAQEQAREARRAEPAPPPPEPQASFKPYRVQLDPRTARLFTEVLDPRTGAVLLRIPASYTPTEEPVRASQPAAVEVRT